MTTAQLKPHEPSATPTADALVERITTRRSELQQRLDAIPADGQLPASATRDDLLRNQQQRAVAERQLTAFNDAVATFTTVGRAEDDEHARDQLITWRASLNSELLAQRQKISARDPRTLGVAKNLELSIEAIDFGIKVFDGTGWELETSKLGELMRAAGYTVQGADPQSNFGGRLPWFGSLPEIEERIAALAERRARAAAALEAVLMSDEQRGAAEQEAAALREAFNSMTVKVGPDVHEPCLVAFDKNRDVLPVDRMTPLQRRAFEAADAAFRAERQRRAPLRAVPVAS